MTAVNVPVVIDGKAVAHRIRREVAQAVDDFTKSTGRRPGLSTILIGDDPASEVYVSNKRRACVQANMVDRHRQLPGDVSQEEAEALIDELADDPDISAILLQLPVPPHLRAEALIDRIPSGKDVDGLTVASVGLLGRGASGLRPCTPSGVIALLDAYSIPIAEAHAVVVGRSQLVGKPMAALLLERDATVTTCHSRTPDLDAVIRTGDIVVVAAGVPGLVTGDSIKSGATVIDVGIHRAGNGLRGDIDFDSVYQKAYAVTPVPGGVGPMTIAMLLRNTLTAARNQHCG